MALQATFRADFTQFDAAVKNARADLVGFEVPVKGVQASLERMSRAFSGANIQREAKLAVAAVEEVGGVTRLTEAEQKRLNIQLTEAIAKYKVMGQTAPESMTRLQRQTASASSSVSFLKTQAVELAIQFAGMFAAFELINAGREVIQFGAEISDLAKKTYLSVEAVQELKYAAEQNGAQFDSVATAVIKLQRNIGQGGTGVVGALNDLGLTLDDLKKLKPEEQFTLVSQRLAGVKDASRQVADGAQLMGRGFAEILPVITSDVAGLRQELRDTGAVMDQDTVNALDAIDDAATKLTSSLKGLGGQGLAPLAGPITTLSRYVDDLAHIGLKEVASWAYRAGGGVNSFANAALSANAALNPLLRYSESYQKSLAETARLAEEYNRKANDLDIEAQVAALARGVGALDGTKKGLKDAGDAATEFGEKGASGAEAVRREMAAARAQIAELRKSPADFAAAVDAIKTTALTTQELQSAFHLSEVAVHLLTKEVQGASAAIAATPMAQLTKKVGELAGKVALANTAGASMEEVLHNWGNEIASTVSQADALKVKVPEALRAAADAANSKAVDNALKKLHQYTAELGGRESKKFWDDQERQADDTSKAVVAAFEAERKAHQDAQDAIAKRTLSATDFQLRQLKIQEQAAIASLEASAGTPAHERAVAQIRALYQGLSQDIIHAGALQVDAQRKQLEDQVAFEKQTLADMVVSHGYTDAEIKRQRQKLNDALHALDVEMGQSFETVLKENLAGAFKKSVDDLTHILVDAFTHGASLLDTVKALGTQIGANFGEAIGGAIGGPLGAYIGKSFGSLLGPLLGKLFKSEQIAANDLRDQLLADLAKTNGLVGTAGAGLGSTFNNIAKRLTEITGEAGGGHLFAALTSAKTQDEVRAAMDAIQAAFDAAKAKTEAFVSALDDVTAAAGRLATPGLIKQLGDIQAGTEEGAAALKYMQANTSNTLAALQDFAQNGTVYSQAAASAIGSSLGTVLQQLQEQGASLPEALAQLGPTVAQLKATFKEAGFSGGAAFNQIAADVKLANDEVAGPLLKGAADIGNVMVGLANNAALSQDQFTGLADQIVQTKAHLEEMGYSSAQVTRVMQPELQQLWQLQQDFGFQTDEATQKLLDEAEASGKVGDQFRSAADRQVKAIEDLVGRIDQLILKLGGGLADAAAQGAAGIEDGLGNVKIDPIDIPYRYTQEGGAPPGVPAPVPGGRKPEGFVGGTNGLRDFGRETLARLHGKEAVLTESQYKSLLGRGGGFTAVGASTTVNFAPTIQGPVFMQDQASVQRFAKFVSKSLMDEMRQKGWRLAA